MKNCPPARDRQDLPPAPPPGLLGGGSPPPPRCTAYASNSAAHRQRRRPAPLPQAAHSASPLRQSAAGTAQKSRHRQAAENAERRQLVPVRKTSSDPGFEGSGRWRPCMTQRARGFEGSAAPRRRRLPWDFALSAACWHGVSMQVARIQVTPARRAAPGTPGAARSASASRGALGGATGVVSRSEGGQTHRTGGGALALALAGRLAGSRACLYGAARGARVRPRRGRWSGRV